MRTVSSGDAPGGESPATGSHDAMFIRTIARDIPPGRYQNVVRDLARQGYEPNKSDKVALAECRLWGLKRYMTGFVAGTALAFVAVRVARLPTAPPIMSRIVLRYNVAVPYIVGSLSGGLIAQMTGINDCIKTLLGAESRLGDELRAVAQETNPTWIPPKRNTELVKELEKAEKIWKESSKGKSPDVYEVPTTVGTRTFDEDEAGTRDPYAEPGRPRARRDEVPRITTHRDAADAPRRSRRRPSADYDEDADVDNGNDAEPIPSSRGGSGGRPARARRAPDDDTDDWRAAEEEENRRWASASGTGSGRRMRSADEEERSRRHF